MEEAETPVGAPVALPCHAPVALPCRAPGAPPGGALGGAGGAAVGGGGEGRAEEGRGGRQETPIVEERGRQYDGGAGALASGLGKGKRRYLCCFS